MSETSKSEKSRKKYCRYKSYENEDSQPPYFYSNTGHSSHSRQKSIEHWKKNYNHRHSLQNQNNFYNINPVQTATYYNQPNNGQQPLRRGRGRPPASQRPYIAVQVPDAAQQSPEYLQLVQNQIKLTQKRVETAHKEINQKLEIRSQVADLKKKLEIKKRKQSETDHEDHLNDSIPESLDAVDPLSTSEETEQIKIEESSTDK